MLPQLGISGGTPAPRKLRPASISIAEAQSLRPRKIDAVRAGAGDTVQSLASRMAGDNKLAHFLMLNGREAGQPLRPGEPLKIVVFAEP